MARPGQIVAALSTAAYSGPASVCGSSGLPARHPCGGPFGSISRGAIYRLKPPIQQVHRARPAEADDRLTRAFDAHFGARLDQAALELGDATKKRHRGSTLRRWPTPRSSALWKISRSVPPYTDDARAQAGLRLAQAASFSPALVDDDVVEACRECRLGATAIVEIIVWLAVLQMLHRLSMFYRA
jgi:alkylhydroperoxidase family enzyme